MTTRLLNFKIRHKKETPPRRTGLNSITQLGKGHPQPMNKVSCRKPFTALSEL